MRKLMLLAAMLAMVLVAAAPALAQATVDSDDDTTNTNTQYCTQVQAALADQTNYGDANAAADDGEAVAAIAQELGISQNAVQNCIQGDNNDTSGSIGTDGSDIGETNGVDDNGDGVVDESGETASGSSGSGSSGSGSSGSGSSAAAGTSVLPDTGGASLFTLGAGALLVGGGLLARRIFS